MVLRYKGHYIPFTHKDIPKYACVLFHPFTSSSNGTKVWNPYRRSGWVGFHLIAFVCLFETWICSLLQIKEQPHIGFCLSRNKQLTARPPVAHAADEEFPPKGGFVKPYLQYVITKDRNELPSPLHF